MRLRFKHFLFILVFALSSVTNFEVRAADLLPPIFQTFLDDNGNVLAGGKIYTYDAGTTTPKATYSDKAGSVANANPIILDGAGRAAIYINAENYKFVVKDSSDVTIRTVDNVTLSSVSALASAFYRDVVYITSANSPYTITSTTNGKLIVVDSSGGAVAINLPEISGIELPFNIAVLLKTAGNNVTVNRAGTDTIMGSASKVISVAGVGAQFAGDNDKTPDDWSVIEFGSVVDGGITAIKLNTSAITGQTQDTSPDITADYMLTYDTSAAALKKVLLSSILPSGMVTPYVGTTAPNGWLLCNGAAVSRTTFAALFAVVGTAHGSGDGSTTFNVPDYRGLFLRGMNNIANVTGSGSAASNNGTFTAHGYTRTGTKVRMASGTLTGLAVNTDYYAIVVDANTLAFSTSHANALAGTKIAISGVNSAVIKQTEDPDASSRRAMASGGNTGANLGSVQEDAIQGHLHGFGQRDVGWTNTNPGVITGGGYTGGSSNTDFPFMTDTVNGTPRESNETRSKNAYVNYIIKY